MNPVAILIGAGVLIISWLIAEFCAGRSVRISLGIFCIIISAMALVTIDEAGSRFRLAVTKTAHRQAMEEMERVLEKKDHERAFNAVRAYNTTYYQERNGGSEAAAFELLRQLRE